MTGAAPRPAWYGGPAGTSGKRDEQMHTKIVFTHRLQTVLRHQVEFQKSVELENVSSSSFLIRQ